MYDVKMAAAEGLSPDACTQTAQSCKRASSNGPKPDALFVKLSIA